MERKNVSAGRWCQLKTARKPVLVEIVNGMARYDTKQPIDVKVVVSEDPLIKVGTTWRVNIKDLGDRTYEVGKWYRVKLHPRRQKELKTRKQYVAAKLVNLHYDMNEARYPDLVDEQGRNVGSSFSIIREELDPPAKDEKTAKGAAKIIAKYPWLKKTTEEQPPKRRRKRIIAVEPDPNWRNPPISNN